MENSNSTPIFDLNSFEYRTNYALEASAGTGKTYSITEIVKKLLVDYKLGLDKILIVTYTEKAAGELKNRIREILNTKEEKLGGKTVKEFLGDEVNCDVDNASIGTIHSFCKNTIKEFAISANQPTDLELADDSDLADFARKYIREGAILDKITSLLSIDYFVDEETLVRLFATTMNAYYLNKNYEEDESIISYLQTYPINQFDELPFKLYTSKNVIETLKNESVEHYDCLMLLKNSTNSNVVELADLIENFREFCRDPRKVTPLKNVSDDKEEKKAIGKLFDLKKPFFKDKDNKDEFCAEIYLVDLFIRDFYKSYQLYKEENKLQSFNDMIRIIRESVLEENSVLLKCLRNKYSYGIIDEFQDTNQIQFDIFKNIFICENHNIIVVGDPKQSIYSYQGADVTVYQEAVNLISKNGKKCRLGKNYRSAIGVVEFGNRLFKNYGFKTGFEPSAYCLLSNKEKERRLKYKGEYVPSLWLNEERLSAEDFAKFALEQIIDCTTMDSEGHTNLQLSCIENNVIKYRNVTFNDFVILARTRTEMPFIQQALKNAGVPSLRYKDTTLFEGIECAQWIALLEAIDVKDFTGDNRGFFKKALFTKFFGLSINEISKSIYDTDDIKEIYLFNKWKGLAKERLWQDLFDTIIIDSELDKHLSSLSDLQSLAVFKQLANYCIEYLSEGKILTELIKHLRAIVKFGDDETDDSNDTLVAKATDFKCVRIMTMHASKGLQFPVVISVAGARGPKTSNDTYSCHHKKADGKVSRVVCLDKTPIDAEVYEEQMAELHRLFYVAYTRPEFLLIAPRYVEKNDRIPSISIKMEDFMVECKDQTYVCDGKDINYYQLKPFINAPYDILRNDVRTILERDKTAVNKDELEKQLNVLKGLIASKKDKMAYKHSYSSLAHPSSQEDNEILEDIIIMDKEGANEEQTIIYDLSAKQVIPNYSSDTTSLSIPDGYPKGAALGNALHETLERLDFQDYESYLEKVIISRFEQNGIAIEGNSSWMDYTKEIINNVLNATLPIIKGNACIDGEFRLNNISLNDKKAEIEFNFNYPKEILKNYLNGFIDLLFKRDDVYSILDWKSDVLENYSDDVALKTHVDERYSVQRVLYSYCLIKWLKAYYKETEEEIFKNHFGGIYYVFVRGCNENTSNGIYAQTWESWSDLEKEFNNIIAIKGN